MDGEASYFPVTFDERLGLVLQMGFDPLPAWEPQIYLVTGRLSRDLLPDGTDTFRQRCISGHAFDPHEAVDAAVGEALERTFASYSHWETAATGDRLFTWGIRMANLILELFALGIQLKAWPQD